MLSKVRQRVRRQSGVKSVEVVEISPPRECVDRAPNLTRWCDLDTPFPSVTFGGYLKYYRDRTKSNASSETPSYSPALSKISLLLPAALHNPGWENEPPTLITLYPVPLDYTSPVEPYPPRTRHLSLASSSTSPPMSSGTRSLRRKRAAYLRAPSLERDFTDHPDRIFTPTLSITTTRPTRYSLIPDNLDNVQAGVPRPSSPTPIQRTASTDSSGADSASFVDSDLFDSTHPFSRRQPSPLSDDEDYYDDVYSDAPLSPATSLAATEEGGAETPAELLAYAGKEEPLKVKEGAGKEEKADGEIKDVGVDDSSEVVATHEVALQEGPIHGEREGVRDADTNAVDIKAENEEVTPAVETLPHAEFSPSQSEAEAEAPSSASSSPRIRRKIIRPDSRLSCMTFMTANTEFDSAT